MDKAGPLGPRAGLRCPDVWRVPSPEALGPVPRPGGWGPGPLTQDAKCSLIVTSLLWGPVSGATVCGGLPGRAQQSPGGCKQRLAFHSQPKEQVERLVWTPRTNCSRPRGVSSTQWGLGGAGPCQPLLLLNTANSAREPLGPIAARVLGP